MVKPTKKMIFLVLFAILFLHGCSFSSLLFNGKTDGHVVVINYPPNRIAYGGKMTKEEKELMLDVLDKLERRPYKPHKFKHKLGVSIDADIDRNIKTSMKHETKVKGKR